MEHKYETISWRINGRGSEIHAIEAIGETSKRTLCGIGLAVEDDPNRDFTFIGRGAYVTCHRCYRALEIREHERIVCGQMIAQALS
jgi:hypothetical protein